MPRFETRLTRDVVYGTGAVRAPRPAPKPLLLDLYEPVGRDVPVRRPGVVLLHGGGWTRGDKRGPEPYSNMTELCRELASRGYVCASINYRLVADDPPGAAATPLDRTIQASVEDARNAVEWMVANAARYGADPARIVIGGSSAGGGTALMLGYGERGRRLPIRAVLDFWGGLGSRVDWIANGGPALLIVHGTADEITDFSAAQELADRAKKVGVPHELIGVPGGRHNVPLDRIVGGVPHYERIAAFLERELP